jgi:hypothetical protein
LKFYCRHRSSTLSQSEDNTLAFIHLRIFQWLHYPCPWVWSSQHEDLIS